MMKIKISKLIIAAVALSMMVSISACGSSGCVTETKVVDSLEDLTISGLDTIDQQLSEAFEDVFSIMTNNAGWVTGGNDVLAQLDEMEKGILEGLNGGDNFDVSGTWINDDGITLTVTPKEDGTYDWEITKVEGDIRKTWNFSGEWNKDMGGMSYEGCVYREVPASQEVGADAEPISSDGKGTLTYFSGELVWKVTVDAQEDGESVTFHR
ncbi:MAG: hypothetical protein J6Y90_07720 [Lachnospiraceae bacterium]|nr:hypothetical protein [Lachnospiraceae bacterium]